MYNLQGIIRKNINNALQTNERIGYNSTNIANYNTNGYKSVRFENLLREDGYLTGALRSDFSNGQLRVTKNPLDIALNNSGFIPVSSETGEITYTRDGSLTVNSQGYLTTNDGHIIGDGIKLPINYYKIEIKPDGTVNSYSTSTSKPEKLGKIPLVQFQNPEGLKMSGNNKFQATQESGEPMLLKEHDYMQQGFIETSNLDMFATINDLMRANASYIASVSIVKMVDDMYSKAINLRS